MKNSEKQASHQYEGWPIYDRLLAIFSRPEGFGSSSRFDIISCSVGLGQFPRKLVSSIAPKKMKKSHGSSPEQAAAPKYASVHFSSNTKSAHVLHTHVRTAEHRKRRHVYSRIIHLLDPISFSQTIRYIQRSDV